MTSLFRQEAEKLERTKPEEGENPEKVLFWIVFLSTRPPSLSRFLTIRAENLRAVYFKEGSAGSDSCHPYLPGKCIHLIFLWNKKTKARTGFWKPVRAIGISGISEKAYSEM
ncbi:MAG: hypothetical protein HYV23_01395 [Deltaproteobacteria bacterium]|nr:hypothetical protein [Deltaproteobacteria bacterium]